MIVKISNNSGMWTYLECNVLHSNMHFLKDTKCLDDALIMLSSGKSNPATTNVKVLSLETQKSHLRTVVTDKVCYILNDQGKTIDKI